MAHVCLCGGVFFGEDASDLYVTRGATVAATLAQPDQSGVCGCESAHIDVKVSPVIVEVHVEPFTIGLPCSVGGYRRQCSSDSLASRVRRNDRVEDECVHATVPSHVHEANEWFITPGANPSETVLVNLAVPVIVQRLMFERLSV